MKDKLTTAMQRMNREWLFALSVTFCFLLFAGFTNLHHELWRDEMQAWLICRDTPSPLAIFHSIRYEGHPALWFLLVWPLTCITRNPESMQWLNLLIIAGAVFLIAKAAPAPRWLRIAFAFGYYPIYEYGSIARNYGIGILLLVAFCAAFPHRREKPLLLGVLLFLAANTSICACLLAIAALFMLIAENIASPPEPSHRSFTWVGAGIALGGIILAVLQMIPPPDTSMYVGWHFKLDPSVFMQGCKNLTAAYLPLPKPGPGYWQSSLLALFPAYTKFSWIAAPIILVLASLALVRRPLALVYYLAGSLGLLVFFCTKFQGYLRHHGFFFVCFGTALWLAGTMPPAKLLRPLEALGRLSERIMYLFLPLLLTVHIAGAVISAREEYKLEFSGAKATAEMMKTKGLGRLPLVAEQDFMTVSVIGYLDYGQAYYPTGGRFGSYIVWDLARAWHYNVWDKAVRLSQQKGSPVVVLIDTKSLGQWSPPVALEPVTRSEGCFAGEVESYCVFLLGGGPILQ